MTKTMRQTAVKITRDLLTKAIVYNCPRYTRNGGVGVPPHACADLADITGNQRNHISRIESGKYSVGFDTLQTIAEALDADIRIVPRK